MKRPPARPRTESEKLQAVRPKFVRQPLDDLPYQISLSDDLLWCLIVPAERLPRWRGRVAYRGTVEGPAMNAINRCRSFAGKPGVKKGSYFCPDTEPAQRELASETWTITTWTELPLTGEQLMESWFGCRCPDKGFNLRYGGAPILAEASSGFWSLIPVTELLDSATTTGEQSHVIEAFSRHEPRMWKAVFHIKETRTPVSRDGASTTAELWTRRAHNSNRAEVRKV